MTLVFSAFTGAIAIMTGAGPIGIMGFVFIIAALFGVQFTKNSWLGLPMTFLFTGMMGYFTGPLVAMYAGLPNGAEIVTLAFGTTAIAFFGLSGYVLTTKKDFSFMGGFLFVGLLVAVVAMIANIFLAIPALSLALSSIVALLMCGYILYDTSRIVNGGETNYISATISLYLDIINLFTSLLHLFGFALGDD
jgi:modulator of FtsH protease